MAESRTKLAARRVGRKRAPMLKDIEDIEGLVAFRIKLRRTALGLTHGQLGELVGRDAGYTKRLEAGEASLSLSELGTIARALGVSADYFLRAAETADGSGRGKTGPKEPRPVEARRQAIEELRELRRGQTLGGLSLRELVSEGRR